jgi:hypothetical protein
VVSGAVRTGDATATGGGVGAPPKASAAGAGDRAAGIFGESFQGIPPLPFATAADAVVGGGVFAIDE